CPRGDSRCRAHAGGRGGHIRLGLPAAAGSRNGEPPEYGRDRRPGKAAVPRWRRSQTCRRGGGSPGRARPVIAVVGASVLVGLAALDEGELDETLVERLLDVTVHVPDIIDVEFHHALRGLLIGKKISAERAEHARDLFADTPK